MRAYNRLVEVAEPVFGTPGSWDYRVPRTAVGNYGKHRL